MFVVEDRGLTESVRRSYRCDEYPTEERGSVDAAGETFDISITENRGMVDTASPLRTVDVFPSTTVASPTR